MASLLVNSRRGRGRRGRGSTTSPATRGTNQRGRERGRRVPDQVLEGVLPVTEELHTLPNLSNEGAVSQSMKMRGRGGLTPVPTKQGRRKKHESGALGDSWHGRGTEL